MISINGQEWRIFLVSPLHPQLQRSNGSYAIGACDNNVKTIYISNDLTSFYTKKVLCHELVHAAMFSYDVDLCERQEELVADLIATFGQEIMDITNMVFDRIKQK